MVYADLFQGNSALTYSEKGYGYAMEKAGSTQGWTFTILEEAFNQDPGVYQNMSSVTFLNGNWFLTFTQEWPIVSQRHQFSYAASMLDNGDAGGVGDTLLNYRYQALTEGPGRPAFSPRVSMIVPTGDAFRLRGRMAQAVERVGKRRPATDRPVFLPYLAGERTPVWRSGAIWRLCGPT